MEGVPLSSRVSPCPVRIPVCRGRNLDWVEGRTSEDSTGEWGASGGWDVTSPVTPWSPPVLVTTTPLSPLMSGTPV